MSFKVILVAPGFSVVYPPAAARDQQSLDVHTSLGPDPEVFAQSWLLVHSLGKGLALTKSLGCMSCVYMLADSLALPIKGCHQFIFQRG